MKKLLLVLLCLPIIGFGQSDMIIFSSGDTIIGKVIEISVNDVSYQYKDETTNNISKKRELAKVIYSSGRIETFEGLKILEAKIAKAENDKLNLQQKEERNKIKMKKREDFKKSLEIGVLFGASLSYNTVYRIVPLEPHITTIQGLILKYNYHPNLSFNTELNYHITVWNMPYNITFTDGTGATIETVQSHIKLSNHYLSIPITLEYSFNLKPKFIIKAGAYSSYLIKSIREWELIPPSNDIYTQNMEKYDLGGIFGIGLSYPINSQLNLLFDCTAYYGLVNYHNENSLFYTSKNRTATAIIGLTYNLKNN
ncbi:MAG: porin family protein [Bacteroidetes bacterium]|nr:porin family protein [Bacteroidota bacterium]